MSTDTTQYLTLLTTVVKNTLICVLGAVPSLGCGYVLGLLFHLLYTGIGGAHRRRESISTNNAEPWTLIFILTTAVSGSGYYIAMAITFADSETLQGTVLKSTACVVGMQIGLGLCAALILLPLKWLKV